MSAKKLRIPMKKSEQMMPICIPETANICDKLALLNVSANSSDIADFSPVVSAKIIEAAAEFSGNCDRI